MSVEAAFTYSGAISAHHWFGNVCDPSVFDDCSRFLGLCLWRGPVETLVSQAGVGLSFFSLRDVELRVWDSSTDSAVPNSPRRTLHRRWDYVQLAFERYTSEGPVRVKSELIGPVHDVPWED